MASQQATDLSNTDDWALFEEPSMIGDDSISNLIDLDRFTSDRLDVVHSLLKTTISPDAGQALETVALPDARSCAMIFRDEAAGALVLEPAVFLRFGSPLENNPFYSAVHVAGMMRATRQ